MPEEKFNPFAEQDAAREQQTQDIAKQAAVGAISATTGISPGTIDKASRIASGTIGFIKNAVVDAPKALAYWGASKFFDDDEIDSPEERKALMTAVGAVYDTQVPGSPIIENLANKATEAFDLGIDQHEGKDFIDLAGEGEYLEAGDAFLGDIASALPSVGAAFLGPGGLALIGSSVVGSKTKEGIESDTDVDTDRILLNAVSSAGGEILSEAFTAGLGGGLTKLAKKLGPKAAKAILRNTGSKLAFSFTGEGLSEVAAEAWDKAGDYALLGDDKAFEGAMRDFGKTFLIGGAIGGGIGLTQIQDRSPEVAQTVRNKVTPKDLKESLKKKAGEVNALYADQIAAEESGADPLVVKAYKDEVAKRTKSIRESRKRIDEQLDTLTADEIAQLDSIGNEIDTYEDIIHDDEVSADDFYANEYAQETRKTTRKIENTRILETKVEALKEKQAKIMQEPSIKNKALSEKNQKLYEKDPVGNATKIADNVDSYIHKNLAGQYYKIPKNERTLPYEDFVSAIKYGKGGVTELVKTYDPAKNTSINAYIFSNLKNRTNRIIKDFAAFDPTRVEKFKPTKRGYDGPPTETVLGLLGVDQKQIDAIANESVDVIKEGKIQKDRTGIRKGLIAKAKPIAEKLIRPGGKSTSYAKHVELVEKHGDKLAAFYLASPGVNKATQGLPASWGYSAGRGIPSRQEFVDYFLGKDLDLKTKEGQNLLNGRKNSLIEKVASGIAQTSFHEAVANNPDVKKLYEADKVIKFKLMSEKIKPGSTTDFAFQENTEPDADDFAAQSQATNKLLEEHKQDKAPDSKKPDEYNEMRDWVGETMSQYFPKSFFNAGGFWNAGSSAAKRGFFFETQADFDAHTEGLKFGKETDIYSQAQRYHYKKHSVDKILKDKATINSRNKANQAAFNEMWRTFDQMIKDNPKNARFIASFLKGAQNSQNHLSRTGAPIIAYSKTGPYTEEHAMPQSAVSRYLLNTLLSKGDINDALKNTNKNFVQVALNTTDDASLKQNKIGPNGANLNSNMPAGWKPSDNWLARYFNSTSNIDPDSIVFLDSGKTVTETYAPKVREQKAPTDNLGKRVGAEFRFNKEIVADKVADQTPHEIDAALAALYKKVSETPADGREAEAIIGLLQNKWESWDVQISTNPAEAKAYLESVGHSAADADAILERSLGFTVGDFIHIDKENLSIDTPMHELSHVWNGTMHRHNPEIFNIIFDKIREEAPEIYQQQVDRIREDGYELDSDSFEYKDEVIAGIVGMHGQGKLENRFPKANTIETLINDYWNAVMELLGFDFAGKDIKDLNVGQVLDLVVHEIATGRVGKNIDRLSGDSWVQTRKARMMPAYALKSDPQFKALQAVKENYRETKDLEAAIQAGYDALPANFDLDTWVEFAEKTFAEAKVGDRTALVVAKATALTINKTKVEVPPPPTDVNQKFNDVLDQKAKEGGKPTKWLIPPSAEDWQGLLYSFLPKGKAGQEASKFITEHLIKPYNDGLKNLLGAQRALTDQWTNLKKGVKLKEKNGKYSNGQLVKIYNRVQNGHDVSRIAKEDIAAAQAAIDGNTQLAQIAEFVNEHFDNDGTDLDWLNKTVGQDVSAAINKHTRTKFMEGFNHNVDTIFDSTTKQKIKETLGADYLSALEGTIKRMKKGSNSQGGKPNPFLKWAQRSVATTMFLNMRSGVLQLISMFNYIGLPNNGIGSAVGNVFKKGWGKTFNKLWNSDYLVDRRQGAKFDVLSDEITKDDSTTWYGKAIDKILTSGFKVTQMADSFAIAFGGAGFVRNRTQALIKDGATEAEAAQQAELEWLEASETSQQSSDPSKISEIQSTEIGKIFFAFGNTPFQYARIAKRRLQDVATGRSKNPRKDLQTAAYYAVGQSLIFGGLQTGALALAFADEDEKLVDEKMWVAIDRAIGSNLKSLGYFGAGSSALYSVMREIQAQEKSGRKDPARIARALLSVSVPVVVKYDETIAAVKGYQSNKTDKQIKGVAGGIAAATGLPADKLLRKWENLQATADENVEAYQRALRFLGWGKWDFRSFSGGGRKKKGPFAGKDPFGGSSDPFKGKDSPFNKGTVGQAHSDGTIEVDPNQSPEEIQKTIAHEEQHVKDMEQNGLDYDDNYVYYKGNKHKRSGGQIEYNGKMLPEGDQGLPWEAKAHAAESPLHREKQKPKAGKATYNYGQGDFTVDKADRSDENLAKYEEYKKQFAIQRPGVEPLDIDNVARIGFKTPAQSLLTTRSSTRGGDHTKNRVSEPTLQDLETLGLLDNDIIKRAYPGLFE